MPPSDSVIFTPAASSHQSSFGRAGPVEDERNRDATEPLAQTPPHSGRAATEQSNVMNLSPHDSELYPPTSTERFPDFLDDAREAEHLATSNSPASVHPEQSNLYRSEGEDFRDLKSRSEYSVGSKRAEGIHAQLEQLRIRADEVRRSAKIRRESVMGVMMLVSRLMQSSVGRPSEAQAAQIAEQLVILERKMIELGNEENELGSLDDQVIQTGPHFARLWQQAGASGDRQEDQPPLPHGSEGNRLQSADAESAAEYFEGPSSELSRFLLSAEQVDMIEERLLDAEGEELRLSLTARPLDTEADEQRQLIHDLRKQLQIAREELEAARDALQPVTDPEQESDPEQEPTEQQRELKIIPTSVGRQIPLDIINNRIGNSRVFPSKYLFHGTEQVDKIDYVNSWLLHKLRFSAEEIPTYLSFFTAEGNDPDQRNPTFDPSELELRYWFSDWTGPQGGTHRQPQIDHTSNRSVRTLADGTQPLVARSERFREQPRHNPLVQTSANARIASYERLKQLDRRSLRDDTTENRQLWARRTSMPESL